MNTMNLLGLGMAGTAAAQGMVQGVAAGQQQYDQQQQRELNRKKAYDEQKLMNLKLAEAGRADALASVTHDEKVSLMEETMRLQAQTLKSQGAKLFQTSTYNTLDTYFTDYDPRHLNTFLADARENPYAPQQLKNIVRVDRLTRDNPQLLQALGGDMSKLDAMDGTEDGQIDWDKLQKRFVLATSPDGSQSLQDMLAFSTMTGYTRYAQNQKLEELKALAELQRKGGTSSMPAEIVKGQRFAELEQKVRSKVATPEEQSEYTWLQNSQLGTKGAQVGIGEDAIKTAEQYINLPFEQFRANPEVGKAVRQIEMTKPLSSALEKKLIDLASLSSVLTGSQGAVNLTRSQTGIVDTFMGKVEVKFSEGVDTRTKNAYGAFINEFRHNLFGSALTDKEIEAFNEAYQNRSDQLPAVLAGLRAAAAQLDAQFKSISNLANPIVMKYRSGTTGEDLSAAIQNIDRKIEMLNQFAAGKITEYDLKRGFGGPLNAPGEGPQPTKVQTTTPAQSNRPSLDSIFGGK